MNPASRLVPLAAVTIIASVGGSVSFAADPARLAGKAPLVQPLVGAPPLPARVARGTPPAAAAAATADGEADAAAGASAASPFAKPSLAVTPQQALTAPVLVNASSSTDAVQVNQTGSARAITGTINRASNVSSAVKGITNGGGAGINGVNTGTTGPAGKFQVPNAASQQPAVTANTTGTGNAVLGQLTTTLEVDTPAVLGIHNAVSYWGIGVEGDGGYIGVKGNGPNYGLFGYSAAGNGAYGQSSTGTGMVGYSSSGTGAYGFSAGASAYGVMGLNSSTGYGAYFRSDAGTGLYVSTGDNVNHYAAWFDGDVLVNGILQASAGSFTVLYANGVLLTSDRNQKQGFDAIDGAGMLDKIAALPITSWDYKATPGIHHVGPMAQDFRAAFGLGTDDTHIEVVDIAGVSLAAIQELHRQLKAKEARIEALEARETQMLATSQAMGARLAALEQASAAAAQVVAPSAGLDR